MTDEMDKVESGSKPESEKEIHPEDQFGGFIDMEQLREAADRELDGFDELGIRLLSAVRGSKGEIRADKEGMYIKVEAERFKIDIFLAKKHDLLCVLAFLAMAASTYGIEPDDWMSACAVAGHVGSFLEHTKLGQKGCGDDCDHGK